MVDGALGIVGEQIFDDGLAVGLSDDMFKDLDAKEEGLLVRIECHGEQFLSHLLENLSRTKHDR